MLESQQVQVQTLRHLVVSHAVCVFAVEADSQHYAEVLFKAVSASPSSAIKHTLSTKGVEDRSGVKMSVVWMYRWCCPVLTRSSQPRKTVCSQTESKGEMEKFSYKSEYIEHFTRVASLHFLIFGEDLELQRCHRKEVSSSGTF